uniref:PsbP C-terminal domain-containing protein n=1 Tax=Oryza punctata TaxID=4537 RepID=A0A0E0LWT5_ORYPU
MAAAVTTTTTAAAAHLCRGLYFSSSSGAKPRRRAKVRCGAAARVEGLGRREALLSVLLSTTAASAPAALAPAAAVAATADWLIGAGEVSGFKSVTAFYPDQVADSNVSVAITGIGPDFTSLKSFGDVDAFAETLVNGLDRSWKRPPGVAAKLIDSRAANGFYYIEYTLQNPGEQRRHIVSAIGMAFNGWYNRLYTVTGQYIDEDGDVDKYRAQIEKCVQSFRFT